MVLVDKFNTILVEDIGYKPDITRIQEELWAIPINKNHLNRVEWMHWLSEWRIKLGVILTTENSLNLFEVCLKILCFDLFTS